MAAARARARTRALPLLLFALLGQGGSDSGLIAFVHDGRSARRGAALGRAHRHAVAVILARHVPRLARRNRRGRRGGAFASGRRRGRDRALAIRLARVGRRDGAFAAPREERDETDRNQSAQPKHQFDDSGTIPGKILPSWQFLASPAVAFEQDSGLRAEREHPCRWHGWCFER